MGYRLSKDEGGNLFPYRSEELSVQASLTVERRHGFSC